MSEQARKISIRGTKKLAVAPDAHRASGRICSQAWKRSLLPFLAWQLQAALRGRRAPAFISDYGEGHHIELVAEHPLPVEIDGDHRVRSARLEITIELGAVRILAPTRARARPVRAHRR